MGEKVPTKYVVYDFVCRHPGMSPYDISRALGLSRSRVRYQLSNLEERGLIKFKLDVNGPRVRKLTYPVGALDLLSKELRSRLKELVNQVTSR